MNDEIKAFALNVLSSVLTHYLIKAVERARAKRFKAKTKGKHFKA